MVGKRLVNTGGAGGAAAFDPLQNFETVTYTGNGGTQKITGYVRKGAAGFAYNKYITFPDLGGFTSNTSDADGSLSIWINLSSIPSGGGFHTLIGNSSTSGVSAFRVLIRDAGSSQIKFEFARGISGVFYQDTTYSNAFTPTLNQWYHLSITYVASTKTASYYINGTSYGSNSLSNSGSYTTNAGFNIGSYNPNNATYSSYSYYGKVDQFRIFNKALSSSEVTTLYGETYASSTKSTTDIFGDGSGVALYELDEDADDTNASSTPIDSGQSGVFNGTSSYISLSNTAFHYTTLSISAWIKVNSFSSTNHIIQNYESGGSPTNSGFLFRTLTDGKINFSGYSSSISGKVESTTILSTGIWYHVAAVITPSSWKIYVNGDDVSTNVTTNTIAYNSTTPCSIGRFDYTGGTGGYLMDK